MPFDFNLLNFNLWNRFLSVELKFQIEFLQLMNAAKKFYGSIN